MKYFVIADSDTVLGFRFAGVRGEEVTNAAEARAALARVEKDPTIGVIIMTDAVAQTVHAEVNRLRFSGTQPLIVEIPSREGPIPGRPSLMDLIREAIGIRV